MLGICLLWWHPEEILGVSFVRKKSMGEEMWSREVLTTTQMACTE